MSIVARAQALELALSELTAALPVLPAGELVEHAVTASALAEATAGTTAALAATLARALGCYAEGQVPLEGWGLVVSSAHTLARAIAEPTGGHAGAALGAARFELESLLPAPGATPAPSLVGPDVPLTSLRRRT